MLQDLASWMCLNIEVLTCASGWMGDTFEINWEMGFVLGAVIHG